MDTSLNFKGNYTFSGDLVVLNYTKDKEVINWKLRPDFKGDTIMLSPSGDIICIEGCYFTIKRVN